MRINKNFFVVRIDKAAQTKRRQQTNSGMLLSDAYIFMKNNMQCGEIIDIGSEAAKFLPAAQIGDLLLFHHLVEYRDKEDGEPNYNDYHFIDQMENGDEIRYVEIPSEEKPNQLNEVFGVFKILEDGQSFIIPSPDKVFCYQDFVTPDFIKDAEGLYIPKDLSKTMEEIEEQLEDLRRQKISIGESIIGQQRTEENFHKFDAVIHAMNIIDEERRMISQKMHEADHKELMVMFINEETNKSIGQNIKPGDTIYASSHVLYPLEFMGIEYILAPVKYIDAISA